jgi:ATP-binding cassette subfamily F protein 3
MVRGIVELDRGKLTEFRRYDDYLVERRGRIEALEEAAKPQGKEIARVRRFVERFRYKSTKARQVQSRVKALDKIERIEAPSRAKRVRFGFPPRRARGRRRARRERAEGVRGELACSPTSTCCASRGSRRAVGPNGAGKSTLLKMLREPDAGRRLLRAGPQRGRCSTTRSTSWRRSSARHGARDARARGGCRRAPRLRTRLGSFLFSGDDVDKRVGVLLGGRKAVSRWRAC